MAGRSAYIYTEAYLKALPPPPTEPPQPQPQQTATGPSGPTRWTRLPVEVITQRGDKCVQAEDAYAYKEAGSERYTIVVRTDSRGYVRVASPDDDSSSMSASSALADSLPQCVSSATEGYATTRLDGVPAAANASLYCYKQQQQQSAASAPTSTEESSGAQSELPPPPPAQTGAGAAAPSCYAMDQPSPAYRQQQLLHVAKPAPLAQTQTQRRTDTGHPVDKETPPPPMGNVPAVGGEQPAAKAEPAAAAVARSPIESCYMMYVTTGGDGGYAPVQRAAVAHTQHQQTNATAAADQSMYGDEQLRQWAAQKPTQPQTTPQQQQQPPPPQRSAKRQAAPSPSPRGTHQWTAAAQSVYMQADLNQGRLAGGYAASTVGDWPQPVVWTGGSGSGHTLVAHADAVRTVSGVQLNADDADDADAALRAGKRRRAPEHVAHTEALRVDAGH